MSIKKLIDPADGACRLIAGIGPQHEPRHPPALSPFVENIVPPLVVTDIVMAAKDGIETIRELRQFAPKMPIVAVSGAEYAAVYLNSVTLLGADAALAKPFSFKELVREVSVLLHDAGVDAA